MPAISASAPGKIILFGEHAVVYGQPAIAMPVTKVRAKALVIANLRGAPGEVRIQAPDIGLDALLDELDENHPLAFAISATLRTLGVSRLPAVQVKISSTIPVASGLGSGAAVSVALIRALASFLGFTLSPEEVSSLAFEVEKLHHGTPSGIDNTVIAHEKPVYFVRSQPLQTLDVPLPFTIVIGDTGNPSSTRLAVDSVRRAYEQSPVRIEKIFRRIGSISIEARRLLETGNPWSMGSLMDENQECLEQLGVSSPELENLVQAARQVGALGAKLSGGGMGGNMVALVLPEKAETLARNLLARGAAQTIITEIRQKEAAIDE